MAIENGTGDQKRKGFGTLLVQLRRLQPGTLEIKRIVEPNDDPVLSTGEIGGLTTLQHDSRQPCKNYDG
ncbi:MAG: hypothetical protein R2825_12695 [Saprospiraceae bacterium]